MRVGCLTTNPMVNHDGSKGGWAKWTEEKWSKNHQIKWITPKPWTIIAETTQKGLYTMIVKLTNNSLYLLKERPATKTARLKYCLFKFSHILWEKLFDLVPFHEWCKGPPASSTIIPIYLQNICITAKVRRQVRIWTEQKQIVVLQGSIPLKLLA